MKGKTNYTILLLGIIAVLLLSGVVLGGLQFAHNPTPAQFYYVPDYAHDTIIYIYGNDEGGSIAVLPMSEVSNPLQPMRITP
jgi:hypothetical protein